MSLTLGEKVITEPCTRCSCRAEGIVVHLYEGGLAEPSPWIGWAKPDPTCACDCHHDWYFIHGDFLAGRRQL